MKLYLKSVLPSRRRAALAGTVLALSTLLSSTAPAAARKLPVFYEGVITSGAAVEDPVWLARSGKRVTGLCGFTALDGSDGTGARVLGKLRGSRLTGNLFNGKNRRIGTFSGERSGASLSGEFAETTGESGTWEATQVVADRAAMRSIAGTYEASRIPSIGNDVALKIRFTNKGSFKGSVYYTGAGSRLLAGTLGGSWIADAGGNLFLSVAKIKKKLPRGANIGFKIPSNGAAVKFAFEKQGSNLVVLNPFDRSTVFLTLKPSRR
ncbi:MAG: hypothetical protein ACK47B_04130 [Armatimonadota bacterium]